MKCADMLMMMIPGAYQHFWKHHAKPIRQQDYRALHRKIQIEIQAAQRQDERNWRSISREFKQMKGT